MKATQSYPTCGACGELGHSSVDCPGQFVEVEEEVNQVYGDQKKYDMNSNSYHPGLRNHPNFKYGNASNQSNPNFQVPSQGGQQY